MQSTLNNSSLKLNPNGNKAKYWTFTIINPNDDHIRKFEDIKEFTTYWIYGKETCPTTGTLHFQCYLAGKKQITKPTMRKWFGDGGNFYAVSLGTPQENKDYCSKDNDFTEWGIMPEARNVAGGEATKQKWTQIVELSKLQKHKELLEEHPKEFLVHYKNIKQIGFDFSIKPIDLDSPCGEWIWGPTGVGKSSTARKENPDAYIKPMNKWWDGYNGQAVVIIEDMSPSFGASMEYFMKIWPDCYTFPAEIKNHIVPIRPQKVVVTSQYHPRQIWFKEAYDAIIRRFKIREIQKLEPKVQISTKSNPKGPLKIKKHDKPFMKPPALKKCKAGKIIDNKEQQPKFVLNLDEAKTMFTPSPSLEKAKQQWDYLSNPKDVLANNAAKIARNEANWNKIHMDEADAQDIDALVDCAEIDAIYADQQYRSESELEELMDADTSSETEDSDSESSDY